MHLTILFFAQLKDRLADRCEIVNDNHPLRVEDLWQHYRTECSEPSQISSHILCAVNQQYARMDQLLTDGDEVAFFPPVTGG